MRGCSGPADIKVYLHRVFMASNPLYLLFYSILFYSIHIPIPIPISILTLCIAHSNRKKPCILPTYHIYMSLLILTVNIEMALIVCFYSGEEMCLL